MVINGKVPVWFNLGIMDVPPKSKQQANHAALSISHLEVGEIRLNSSVPNQT